ncbi:hypothetical protein [Aeoliella mucimassa]|uniref:Uncharacterized protein n=1 Tax=Aeoliella mucimassa TaxID=2527972 RepID=A0A518AHW4_9BACT|nr:hypothetical protein [Aeoliella mucimassa]QDU54321.1 hypothetical protein Pan181_05020 [Aeoliella mucimassa]
MQTLQEYVDSSGQTLRVDADHGVLRGVKLLGLTSKNGRTYQPQALAAAAALYEGAKVNVNHPKSGSSPRDYQDRLGAVRQVVYREGEGLFADLHFNPKHPLAPQLAWDAEHAPSQVGLSHNVLARTSHDGNTLVVEEITKVESVDLVADPATTRGLFESNTTESKNTEAKTIEATLREQVARLKRELRIVELLAKHGLPLPSAGAINPAVSPAFLESLTTAKDEPTLEALVADRAALVRQPLGTPVTSREQHWFTDTRGQQETAAEFAAALRR